MVTPRATVGALATERFGREARMSERAVRSDRQPRFASPLTRQYEVAYLTYRGEIEEFTTGAPATPIFEDAFMAFARGTLISTEDGQIAVEDLAPGMLIGTASEQLRPLLWVGTTTLVPSIYSEQPRDAVRLTRISSDAFGPDRPAPDLVLGPRARTLYRSPRCREMLSTDRAFAPAHALMDGVHVTGLAPLAPVQLYHLCLHGQQTIRANGIEVESYHPGLHVETMMDPEDRELFLALFPWITRFDGFGTIRIPRLTAFEFESLRNG